ncbi:MAG: tetratricopeptide repeat-containing sensor histidine kinase [Bacteroidota bacterium]|nr:tetratricopeptide repeat-containing sensor histidine kinase [Bacteroidota bacterium]MDP4196430.1 tetratricopeptide repeat-containing sensor histidine kinase [Bacteroidota bacterium]
MKKVFVSFLAAVLLGFAVQLFPFNKTDSLETIVKNRPGIEKIDALNKLSFLYKNSLPQKALEYSKQALMLSEKSNYLKGQADSYSNFGQIYSELCKYNLSKENHLKALQIRRTLGNKSDIAFSLNFLGESVQLLGNYEEAMQYFLKAVKIEEETSDLKGLSTSYSLIATLNYILKDYQKSIEYCNRALNIRKKLNDNEAMANTYEMMGLVYYDQNNFPEALKYHQLALKLRLSTNDKIGISGSYQNLGIINRLMQKFDIALYYYNKALKLREELGDKGGVASSIFGIGQVYEKQCKYNLALSNFLEAYKIRSSIGDKRGMASSLKYLSKLCTKTGDYKKAFEYQTLYYSYKDSLNDAQSLEKITALNLQYKSEKKDKDIALLQKENLKQKNVRNIWIAGFLFVTFIALVIFAAYRSKQKINTLLNQKNHEISQHHKDLQKLNAELRVSNATKDKFFSILAHDLRSPFFGLLGLAEDLVKNSSSMTKEEISEHAAFINQSARKIFGLLNNLLEWSALQSGRIEPEPEQLDLYIEVENIRSLFVPSARNKSIKIINEVQKNTFAFADKNILETVLRNLLSNAIKFTCEGGKVTIRSKDTGNQISLMVEDSGIGMSKEKLDKIFRIDTVFSTKGTCGETGSGLGMVLSKDLVEKNGGNISVTSILDKGSTFAFTLPSLKQVKTKN